MAVEPESETDLAAVEQEMVRCFLHGMSATMDDCPVFPFGPPDRLYIVRCVEEKFGPEIAREIMDWRFFSLH